MMGMNRRNGFALPATLLALVVVGALVTGGVYAAMEHDRTSGNADVGQLAFRAAERGLDDLMGTWLRADFEKNVPVVGQVDTVGPVAVTIGGLQAQYTLHVKRLNTLLFMVESEGEVVSGGRYAGSTRRVGEVMRISYTYFPKDRAVTTHVGLKMVGKSGVRGIDTIPAGWDECSNLGTKTGVVAKDETTIKLVGAAGVEGNPEVASQPSLDSAAFVKYGDLVLDDLIDVANITLPPGNYNNMAPAVDANGECDGTVQLNWGDPQDKTGACHYYWPIIYSPGDLHLNTGFGQGILIVGGDLELGGNVEFSGLVFVYGAIKSVGSGNKVMGSVSVLGASPDESDLTNTGAGATMLQLSSCAIERAYLYNDRFARPIPLAERKFVDVSGLGVD